MNDLPPTPPLKERSYVPVVVLSLLFILGTGLLYAVSIFALESSAPQREVTVYVSLPLALSTGQSIKNGISLAISQREYTAGMTTVRPIFLDDGDETGAWVPEKEIQNAESATNDPLAVAYIGPYNSGAAKLSMPILNRAGIVQISPGNTWPGLTKPGFLPGEPGTFYPAGVRHYFRVVPTDDLQGPAGALWAKKLGFTRIFVVDDNDVYGKGIADLFTAEAERLGLIIVGREELERSEELRDTSVFETLVDTIMRVQPDLVYYGGVTPSGAPELLRAIRMREDRPNSTRIPFMGPDGILEQDFIDRTGAEYAEGVYATTIGAPPSVVESQRAQSFAIAYTKRFNTVPDVFAAFGYEATEIIFDAIRHAKAPTRDSVLQEVRKTSGDGLFGQRIFDANGDTRLTLLSGHRVENGIFVFVEKLAVP